MLVNEATAAMELMQGLEAAGRQLSHHPLSQQISCIWVSVTRPC